MKNIMFAMLFAVSSLNAQTVDTTMVAVPKATLTASQLAQLDASAIKQKAAAYGEWVGVGKEVGEAVNSSLSAISDNAAKFADTKVGKLAMAIVVWKVLGNDILGVVYALIIVFIALPVLIWSYRRHNSTAVLTGETVVDGKVTAREYRPMNYNELDHRGAILLAHAVAAATLLISMSFALFG